MAKRSPWFSAAFALVLTGCQATGAEVGGADPSNVKKMVTVKRASISQTIVLPATVEASPWVVVTAPKDGVYTVAIGRIEYRLNNGRSRNLRVPRGLEVLKPLIPPESRVPQNYPLAKARVAGFALVAAVDRSTLFKMYSPPVSARGQIEEGPGPFACPLANRVPLDHGASSSEEEMPSLTLTCIVPDSLRVFSGMPSVMAVNTGTARDVLVLPVEAVAGSVQQGAVWMLDRENGRHLRPVQLGTTDGVRIEVKSGLRAGDRVLIPGPDLMDRDA